MKPGTNTHPTAPHSLTVRTVGYAPSIRSTTDWAPVPLDDVLGELTEATADDVAALRARLAEGDTDTAAAVKGCLPAFTPSASYQGSRTKAGYVAHTGLLSFDIDGKDNGDFSPEVAERLRDVLAGLPYVAYAALSASGAGVWGLIPIEVPAIDYAATRALHGRFFAYVAELWRDSYGVTLDGACKDVGRARYLAYDAEAKRNPDATALTPRDLPTPPVTTVPAGRRTRRAPRTTSDNERPGDHYNREHTPVDVLTERYGWAVVREHGGKTYLRRPGETTAEQSGNFDAGHGVFVAHTSSTPLPPETGLTAFAIRAYYDHGGDFAACAKVLAEEGYGERAEGPRAARALVSAVRPDYGDFRDYSATAGVVARTMPGLSPDFEEPGAPVAPESSPPATAPPTTNALDAAEVGDDPPSEQGRENATEPEPWDLPDGHPDAEPIAQPELRLSSAWAPVSPGGVTGGPEPSLASKTPVSTSTAPESSPPPDGGKPPLPPYFVDLIASLRMRGEHDRAEHYVTYCGRTWELPEELTRE